MNVHISFSCLLLRKNIVWVEKSKNMVLELKVTRGIKLFFGMTIFFNRDQSTRSAKSTIKLESLNNQ
jgi:hypothetical protein